MISFNKYDILNSSTGKADFVCQKSPLICEKRRTVFSVDRMSGGILLEDDMPTGVYERTELHKKIYRESANPYWKGKTMPLSLRKKLSEAHKGKTHSSEWKKKMSEKFSGKGNPSWNGGTHLSRGYVYIYAPLHPCANKDGYAQESHLVIENIIGRCIYGKETVHHGNKITNDNNPSNLMLFSSHSAHKRFENGGIIKPEEILFDGRICGK